MKCKLRHTRVGSDWGVYSLGRDMDVDGDASGSSAMDRPGECSKLEQEKRQDLICCFLPITTAKNCFRPAQIAVVDSRGLKLDARDMPRPGASAGKVAPREVMLGMVAVAQHPGSQQKVLQSCRAAEPQSRKDP